MFGFGGGGPVEEYAAKGANSRAYHEIRQTLRVSGVNLNFRTWASYDDLLPVLWDAVKPNTQTRAFEDATDRLRAEAAGVAESLGPLAALPNAGLGKSQTYQVHQSLRLYHYVNPKLLLLTEAIRLALLDESELDASTTGSASKASVERIVPGPPPRMYPMDMVAEDIADPKLQKLFADIKSTMAIKRVNSDYRTLALWPEYLDAAWTHLKPIVLRSQFKQAGDSLRDLARRLAADLPLPVRLSRGQLEAAGASYDDAVQTSEAFERLLPELILNIALCLSDWDRGETLAASPFPAESAT